MAFGPLFTGCKTQETHRKNKQNRTKIIMADIIPAIMPKTLADLEEHVARVAGAVEAVQVDVMDGLFVKPKTWPYIRHDAYFDEIMNEDRGTR